MVSLGDESRRSGGYFFDQSMDSAGIQDSEVDLLESTSLGVEDEPGFRKIKTTSIIILEIILMMILEVSMFILPGLCADNRCGGVSASSVVIYSHSALWYLLMVLDRCLWVRHHESRLHGYLSFHRKTRNVRRAPLTIFSGGTALLLVMVTVLGDYCHITDDQPKCSGLPLTPVNYLQIIVSIEILVILGILTLYLVWTLQFNQKRAPPDIYYDNLSSLHLSSQPNSDIGFKDENYIEDIMEKQADVINYLHQHNARLSKMLLKMAPPRNIAS